MQPSFWQPPVELSEQEELIVKRIRRAKLFVFLRYHRHELLDEAFRAANEQACIRQANEADRPLFRRNWHGPPFCKPTQESRMMRVIEAMLMDRRWQLVLDCLDTDQAPFEPRNAGGLPKTAH